MILAMASQQKKVGCLLEPMTGAGLPSAKQMFGVYGLSLDDRPFALVCDDQLFMEPTSGGRAYASEPAEWAFYPGAKPCLPVAGDRWDEADWLAEVFTATVAAFPAPVIKQSQAKPPSQTIA